ncbi:TonB-dependent siderophore receptor, partial [Pseudomonas savastanoi pv. glycinea str. race 4]
MLTPAPSTAEPDCADLNNALNLLADTHWKEPIHAQPVTTYPAQQSVDAQSDVPLPAIHGGHGPCALYAGGQPGTGNRRRRFDHHGHGQLAPTAIDSQYLGTATDGTGSYTTGAVSIGKGAPQSLRETPQSVSVVTR